MPQGFMKIFQVFIKPFEAAQREKKKFRLIFSICPGSDRKYYSHRINIGVELLKGGWNFSSCTSKY